jgi:N-acetylglutamate synthase-like GNAT family acetyltransferase
MANIEIRQITSPRSASESNADIASLVNEVYAVAESGMWSEAHHRVTEEEITRLIAEGGLFGAYLDEKFVGCIKLHQLNHSTAEFGMLAVDPKHRSSGAGGKLVKFVEDVSRKRGTKVMECGAMMPRNWEHPSRAIVAAWYMRIGYQVASRESFEEKYPRTKGWLLQDIDHIGFEKKLVSCITSLDASDVC